MTPTSFNERLPRFSPDGRWLAYLSDETGADEVYVQSYPDPAKRWRVSTDGGESPAWAQGAELFYVNGDRMMMVTMGDRPSVPRVLFEAPLPDQFAGSPDGQRFLMIQRASPTHINVVLDWFEELKRRVPAGRR